jgi:hypothetical protein
MPDDPRPRYHVLQPITETHGRSQWLRVGIAYKNPDGTIDAYLDLLMVGVHFRLREVPPYERGDTNPDVKTSLPEEFS